MEDGLSLSPDGRLVFAPKDAASATDARDRSVRLQARLVSAFHESSAAGLLELARADSDAVSLPVLQFWRGFGRRVFGELCKLGSVAAQTWGQLPPPAPAELNELAAAAPPMRGLEYLDAAVLQRLWHELAALAAARSAAWKDGPVAFLHDVDPLFHQIGRVTFHLAENKRDPARPFAFLATYSHRVTERAKVSHLPLAEALKTYAGARNTGQLQSLLAPVERAAEASPLVRELLESRALFAPQAWSIRQAYRFLQSVPQMEQAGVVVRVPDWWSARRPPRPQVEVHLGARPPSGLGLDGLLDFHVALTLDGADLTAAERRQLLAATDGLLLLRGKWVEVDREKLNDALEHWQRVESAHAEGIGFIDGMRLLAGIPLATAADADDGTRDWSSFVAGDWLQTTLAQLRSPTADRACQPGRNLQTTLRPYQVEGVRWLWFLTQLGLGGCLADDMGLGKTVQVIDLLLQQRRTALAGQSAPNLLVVPASLLGNWRSELSRFAPSIRVVLLHRSECDAETLAAITAEPRRTLDYDLVITTYGLLRRQPWLADVTWSLIILDEAQAIKNAASGQAKSVKRLAARARLVLTGTPIENHLGDLWSLFDFACPGLLGTAAEFKKYVKTLSDRGDPQAYAGLRRLVRPYILRRLKTDPQIVPDLPPKTELRTECSLSKKQAVLYEKTVAELARRLEESEGIQRRGIVLATLMQLKQICNHPAQFLQRADFAPQDSGKFERLRLLCEPIVERQERMLVFTQFQSLTEPLAGFLATVFGRPGLVLHGSTPVKRRPELVQTFQQPDGPPFFVISLKAGGSGLNLTAAAHVIHFDRWWNPAVENQATDRAFRIGQTRHVLVHKFVCRGTVEERIDELIASKRDVADQILRPDDAGEIRLTELSDAELLGMVTLDVRRALDDG